MTACVYSKVNCLGSEIDDVSQLWVRLARSLLLRMRRTDLSPGDFEVKHFLLEQLTHEILDVNGKLPRTLRVLLTQPGEMAVNYVMGKRQRFVAPLRLYLILFLLHAFIAAVFGGPGASLLERVREFDVFGLLSHLISS